MSYEDSQGMAHKTGRAAIWAGAALLAVVTMALANCQVRTEREVTKRWQSQPWNASENAHTSTPFGQTEGH